MAKPAPKKKQATKKAKAPAAPKPQTKTSPGDDASPRKPAVGCHCSTAGGHDKALRLGARLGCECVQVFTKNNMQWFAKPLEQKAVDAYVKAREETGLANVFAHSGYLINLAGNRGDNLEKSRQSLLDELERCSQLELPFLVLHPGAHLGEGEAAGIKRILESLDWVFERYTGPARIALETTAGAGTVLGARLEHLAAIFEGCPQPERLAVCLDTCHLFCAGYDMRTRSDVESFVAAFKRLLDWNNIVCVHINDSKTPFAGGKDRHELLGQGEIGWECFDTLLAHTDFRDIPLCLETPKGKDNINDIETLKELKARRRRLQG